MPIKVEGENYLHKVVLDLHTHDVAFICSNIICTHKAKNIILFIFETESHYIDLAGLELAMENIQALNSQRST